MLEEFDMYIWRISYGIVEYFWINSEILHE